jgi:hypothetical protein
MGGDRGALVGVPVKMSCTLNWENMLTIFSWKMAAMIRESKKVFAPESDRRRAVL